MTGAVERFLSQAGWGAVERAPLAGDASARRYERLTDQARGQSAVLMIAPPGDRASFEAFLSIARHLRSIGLSAPQIWAAEADQGLMLMEDFGDALVSRWVEAAPDDLEPIYTAATDLLTHLAAQAHPRGLDTLNATRLTEMTAPVFDALADGVDAAPLRDALWPPLTAALRDHLDGRLVLVLRDLHAENLVWLPERAGHGRLGLLDFQDAVTGPVGYDLISLLDDARRDVPEAVKARLIARQAAELSLDKDQFAVRCALLSVQRNLRILGIFDWLAREAGKPEYLKHQPRVAGHIRRAVAHPALAELAGPVVAILDHLPIEGAEAVAS